MNVNDVIKFILLSSNELQEAFQWGNMSSKRCGASINFCARVFNFMHQSITLRHNAIKAMKGHFVNDA